MLYLPQTLRLFGQRWLIRAARPNELTACWGECRPDQLEVVIQANQNEEMQMHTYLHEIIHCIEQKLELELTERQTDLIALGLIDLIKNNEDFLEQFGPVHRQPQGDTDGQ